MLSEYEKDHGTGMDILEISREIYFYTSGYPYLVSRLCKWIDEEGGRVWSTENVRKAECAVLNSENTLFDDLIKNIENDAELKRIVKDMLLNGLEVPFVQSNEIVKKGLLFGFFSRYENNVRIANVIFETYLYNHFLIEKLLEKPDLAVPQSQFIRAGRLDMAHILEKFQEVMKTEYRKEDEKFLERQGRLLFLCYLKPVINGVGFYYVEPETRDSSRMDIVVAYGGEEHIIELKMWRGSRYREDGIRQLESYMESRGADTGYLISFSFLKNKKYTSGWIPEEETGKGKRIFEVTV